MAYKIQRFLFISYTYLSYLYIYTSIFGHKIPVIFSLIWSLVLVIVLFAFKDAMTFFDTNIFIMEF